MLHIKCPYCGMRSQNEFAYGGDASVKRPDLNKEISDKEWDNFVKKLFAFFTLLKDIIGVIKVELEFI